MAFPKTRSERPFPYPGAVSKKLIPLFIDSFTELIESLSSCSPHSFPPANGQVPSANSETSIFVFFILLYFILI